MLTLNSCVVEKLEKAEEEDVVISINNISKRFCRNLKRSLYYGMKDIMREILGLSGSKGELRDDEFWALKDISFTLKKGEAVGLVGANGAGKTTLLKIISGLIKPDAGSVSIKGRMAPMIGLGAGFNHVLSGRENVFINMSILGLTNEQINEKFDEVLNFSEIGDAIDAPVKTYSSGMVARLGFACAIHTDPDILLIDEVLAVGDIKFRLKCYRRLAHLRKMGTSFILVSHSVQSILSTCETGVYLKKGKMIAGGNISDVINTYEDELFQNATERFKARLIQPIKADDESFGLDINEVYFESQHGVVLEELFSGEFVNLCIVCTARTNIKHCSIRVIIRDLTQENNYMLTINSEDDGKIFKMDKGVFVLKVSFPALGLRRGSYTAKISLSSDSFFFYDAIESLLFNVRSTSRDMIESSFYQVREWFSENHELNDVTHG
jgi:lipopolysaccharide transport system ATP-binding protein